MATSCPTLLGAHLCSADPWVRHAGAVPATVRSSQVESEKRQEHEAQRLREHLAMLLGTVLEAEHLPGGSGPLGQSKGPWEAGRPGPGVELSKAEELLQRCEALERKTATFENIVCVLNREVERVAMTTEACGRQHRLDQDRIETLSNQVCALGSFPSWGSVTAPCSPAQQPCSGLIDSP